MFRQRKVILTALGVFFACGVVYFFWTQSSKNSGTADEQKIFNVSRGDLQISVLATGTVLPENRLEIKPPVSGRIEKILVQEGQRVHSGQVLALMSSTERSALLDIAIEGGPEEVKKWEDIYKPTPILAPITGTIILRNIEVGQTFSTTDAVLVMSNHLTVKAQVDETDLALIKVGQSVEVRLDSYPEKLIAAKVERLAYEAKTVSNVTSYLITVRPLEIPEFMRSGMTADVVFQVETKKNTLLVPTEAIQYFDGVPNLNVQDGPGKVSLKKIEIGSTDGKQTEVLAGVIEGDKVVVLIPAKEKKSRSSNPLNPFSSRPPGGNRPPSGGGGPPP